MPRLYQHFLYNASVEERSGLIEVEERQGTLHVALLLQVLAPIAVGVRPHAPGRRVHWLRLDPRLAPLHSLLHPRLLDLTEKLPTPMGETPPLRSSVPNERKGTHARPVSNEKNKPAEPLRYNPSGAPT